jgi:hypothetical protein
VYLQTLANAYVCVCVRVCVCVCVFAVYFAREHTTEKRGVFRWVLGRH